jgi:hypothetical protein
MRKRGIWAASLAAALPAALVACVFELAPLEPGPKAGAGAGAGAGGAGGQSSGGGGPGVGGGGAPGACGGELTCVPAAPMGSDLLALKASAGPCPGGLKEITLVECGGCGCAPSGSGVCDVTASLHGDNLCGASAMGSITPSNTCNSSGGVTGPNGGYVSALVKVAVVGTASCAPTSADAPSTTVNACVLAPNTAGCAEGEVCVPGGLGELCVVLSDGAACPAGYPIRRAVTMNIEVKTCSCACEACGDLVFSVFEEEDCAGKSATFAVDGTCKQTTLSAIQSAILPNSPAATCATRGTPQSADPTKALCCVP